MSSIFGITYRDIQRKITPNAINDNTEFVIGGAELSEADCNEIILRAEDKVKTNLDPKYRRLLSRVDGEIVCKYSISGQTTVQTSFYPISNLKVYVNYSESSLSWAARNPSLEANASNYPYTADTTTGLITFTAALPEGSRVFVEYSHTGSSRLKYLRDIAETLAAVEISRRFAYFRTADGFNRFLDWETLADKDLAKLRFRDVGVPELDDLDLIEDDTDEDQFNALRRIQTKNLLYQRPQGMEY
jgi:hypothetical protein